MSAGIDYGMGMTNRDSETGIRYGVISQHSVGQAWSDSAEPDYGDPSCPKCGNKVVEFDADQHGEFECERQHECADFVCEFCERAFSCDRVTPDEPNGWSYHEDGYELVDCLDFDVMVLKSPFYTLAPFCSPCVPGAGNLDDARDDGVETYCLGHDWFEDGKAPYPVFDVVTRKEIAA